MCFEFKSLELLLCISFMGNECELEQLFKNYMLIVCPYVERLMFMHINALFVGNLVINLSMFALFIRFTLTR